MTKRIRPGAVALFALGGFTLACAAEPPMSPLSGGDAQSAPMDIPDRFVNLEVEEEAAKSEEKSRRRASGKKSAPKPSAASTAPGAPPPPPEPEPMLDDDKASTEGRDDGGAPTRAWFPETFLFQPEVVTNAQGVATVSARVPDRLTTWRVLALAHDRSGHQAGDVARFTSSLPLYADPVVPASLRVGDRIQLAIPVVNTTQDSRSVDVAVRAEGIDVRGGGRVAVPGLGSAVARAELAASAPGLATVHAALNVAGTTEDAVEHSIPIVPTGQRHASSASGTLGAARTVTLALPDGADPASAEARLTLVPGGLGVIQAEVASAASRAHGASGAGLLLTVSALAPQLWEQAGLPVSESGEDPAASARFEQARTLRLLGVQQAMRLPSQWDETTALAVVAGAAAHPDDPVLSRLVDHGITVFGSLQRPDGTFGGSTRGDWTVQRMLVATAFSVDVARRAASSNTELAPERLRRVAPMQVRGRAAAERYAGRVTDAYTASALLVGGLVEGETRDRMATIVRDALTASDNGLVVDLPKGVLRVDGRTPSRAAAAALAARALATLDDPSDADRLADLGSTVLAGFRPGAGWGDAVTDLVCLGAVAELWAAPPAETVTLTLKKGDDIRATRALTVDDLRNPVFLSVPADGDGAWEVATEPAVPGLAFGLEVVSWTPWTHPPTDPGIEVAVSPPERPRLGETGDLVVDIASHRGTRFELSIDLPAGVQADGDAITIEGGQSPSDTTTRDGHVSLSLPPLTGNRLTVHIPVSPTVAGTVWSGGVAVVDAQSGAQTVVPPTAWKVGG